MIFYMKCKDCTDVMCPHRTTDGETECKWSVISSVDTNPLSPKARWISETAVKILASIPYEYVSSGIGGQTMEPRHLYAARIAKEMADTIFG